MFHASVGTRTGAVCALILTCACAFPAEAQPQNAAADNPLKKSTAKSATKSATPKTTASPANRTSAHQHYPTAAAAQPATPAKGTTRSASAGHSSKHPSRKTATRVRGQQKIDSERARSIQEALIREHYLSGQPSGTWNQASEEAMRRYQNDHGWQTKEVPDSRALIKLGLGPSNDHLLNPESAMTTAPDAPRAASTLPASHGSQPASAVPTRNPAPSDPPSPQ